MSLMLSAIIGAIGNRGWGAEECPNWIGALLIAIAIFLHGLALWTLPILFLLIYVFRIWSIRPELHVLQYNDWFPAIIRALAVLPLGIFVSAVTLSIIPYIIAALAVFLIPTMYWFSGRYRLNKKQPVEQAELLVGTILGLI